MARLPRPSEIDPRYENAKYVGELLWVEPSEVEHDVVLGDNTHDTVVRTKITVCSGQDEGKVYEDVPLTATVLVRIAAKSLGAGFAARLTQPDKAYRFSDIDEADEETVIRVAGLPIAPDEPAF